MCVQKGRERILSRLRAVSAEPDSGFKPTNHEIMTLTEIKSWTLNQMSHRGAARICIFNNFLGYFQKAINKQPDTGVYNTI